MHLYETHLSVADTNRAQRFYREIVGLPFAYRDPRRDIVFLWADSKEKAMIGLWGPNTSYGSQNEAFTKLSFGLCRSAGKVTHAINRLNENGIETFGFGGERATEPSVIGWMPSAQIYFRDPDGHMLEFITILPEPPNPSFNGLYSEWQELITNQNACRSKP